MRKLTLAAAVLGVAHLTCAKVPLTAPSGSTVTLTVNPDFVPANGGVSLLTVVVIEPAGTLAPDGTTVYFLTTLGRVDPEAKTKGGFARANFVSDSRSGIARVEAFSGALAPNPAPTTSPTTAVAAHAAVTGPSAPVAASGVAAAANSDSKDITVGSALPRNVIVTASPTRILEPRNTEITATVFDEFGNPVSNVPIIFRVDEVSAGRLVQEELDSGSQPRYTNTNGQARDTLRTRQNRADPQKSVTVLAITPIAGTEGVVEIAIN
jgi:hypothetical protein